MAASTHGEKRPDGDLWKEETVTVHESSANEIKIHFRRYPGKRENPASAYLFLVHGAGQSLHSWVPMVNMLYQLRFPVLEKLDIIMMDLRGHGKSVARNEYDLRMDQLVCDCVELVKLVAGRCKVFLAGHSIGGAVCTHAGGRLSEEGSQVGGVVMVDMVEESAAQVLKQSQDWILQRPKGFSSVQAAIDWNLAHRVVYSRRSAEVTIPAVLVEREEDGKTVWLWRTDLSKTFTLWEEWFKGVSKRFVQLKASMGKLLILHERGRLDKDLIVGHMQGKFQLALVPGERVGHFVHEDEPLKVASEMNQFISRYLSAANCTGLTAAEVVKLKHQAR